MRFISAALVAVLMMVQGLTVSAAPVSEGLKSQSALEFIKAKKKAVVKKPGVKAKKHKKHHLCGMGKYHKGGKCVSASDKK